MEKNRRISYLPAFIFAIVSEVLLGSLSIMANFNYMTAFRRRLIFSVSFILIIWALFFIVYIVVECKYRRYSVKNITVMTIFSLLTAGYIVNGIWNSGYLSLNPVKKIVEGTQHIDSLYHSTLAGGFATFGKPSMLINSDSIFHYHYLSHMLLGAISAFIKVPTFLVYNFIYPVIFIPIHIFLTVAVIIRGRNYFKVDSRLSTIDFLCITCAFMGILPGALVSGLTISSYSRFLSESYCVANAVVLLYLFVLLHIVVNDRFHKILLFVINPAFIFLSIIGKVSVGVIFTIVVSYFIFREHIKEPKFYFLLLYYGAISLISMVLCRKSISGATNEEQARLFHYVTNNVSGGVKSAAFHYFFMFLPIIIYIWYRARTDNASGKDMVLSERYAFEQALILGTIVSALPGVFLKINGGSAWYFSNVPNIFGYILLLSINLPNHFMDVVRNHKKQDYIMANFVVIILFVSLILRTEFINRSYFINRDVLESEEAAVLLTDEELTFDWKVTGDSSFIINLIYSQIFHQTDPVYSTDAEGRNWTMISEETLNSTFYKNMEEIYQLTRDSRKEYAIFIDDSAEFWQIYAESDSRELRFIYPAMTNLLCLNEVYTEKDELLNRNGSSIGEGYLAGSIREEEKKSLQQVMESLPTYIHHIVVLEGTGYRVVDVE